MDLALAGILSGNDPTGTWTDADVKKAVAERFKTIRSSFKPKAGSYLYGYSRTAAGNLGWRFIQNLNIPLRSERFVPDPKDILAGKYDAQIEATWHDAASAEDWYANEKDWGE